MTFCQCVSSQFSTTRIPKPLNNKPRKKIQISKPAEITYILSYILSRPSKNKLKKSKYHQKKCTNSVQNTNNKGKKLYVQALSININKVLEIKENFPNLSTKKIKNIHRIINKPRKKKPQINIITKSPSRRQIIVLMSNNNILRFMLGSSTHITNINRTSSLIL